MRWLLTDKHDAFSAALNAAGHEVVNSEWRAGRTSSHYRSVLKRALATHKPGVLVVVNPGIGYHKSPVVTWPGEVRGRIVVFISTNDPAGYKAFKRLRGCLCRQNNCRVFITNDPDTATINAGMVGRTALWNPGDGVAHIMAAIAARRYVIGKAGTPWLPTPAVVRGRRGRGPKPKE